MKKILFLNLLALFSACSNNSQKSEDKYVETTIHTDIIEESKEKSIQEKQEDEVLEEFTEANECNGSEIAVYLNDDDLSGTNIRKSPGGEVLLKLIRDDNNIGFILTISEVQNGWFKLKNPIEGMETNIEIPKKGAWIHGSVITASTRNYGGQKINLLDHPKNGKVVGSIEAEVYELIIKDLCGAWVQIEYNGILGWIEASWLCGNPVTSCS